MKIFILFIHLSFFASIGLSAQPFVNNQSEGKSIQTLKFIEGIEIIVQSGNTSSPASFISPKPAIFHTANKPSFLSANLIENSTGLQFKYAQLLNTEVESLTNLALYNFIEDWWETKYQYGGTTKSGVDCSGFTGNLMNKVYKYQLPRTATSQYDVCDKISKNELKEGDLIFFNTRGGISHVGMYLANGFFVHSSTSKGVTISSLEEEYYKTRFFGSGRITNLPKSQLAHLN